MPVRCLPDAKLKPRRNHPDACEMPAGCQTALKFSTILKQFSSLLAGLLLRVFLIRNINMAVKRPNGPRHKIPSTDYSFADGLLEAAALLMIPADQGQHAAFERLMPRLYILKEKGFSILQITELLNQSGFKLQPSTVRIYYNELLAKRMDQCQSLMSEQILLLAEIRKETQGASLETIRSRVEGVMAKQQAQVTSRIDSVLALNAKPGARVSSPIQHRLPSPVEVVTPGISQNVDHIKAGIHPAPQPQTQSAATRANDDLPVASVLKPMVQRKAGLYQDETYSVYLPLRCSVLPEGVIPLKRREGFDEAIYLPGDLEHPYLPGVMLSLEQRLSSIALEFVNTEDGEVRMETPDEKRFRVLWRKPIPMTISSSSHEFTKMDMSLFRK